MGRCERSIKMDRGFESGAQSEFRWLRSSFHHFLPDIAMFTELQHAGRFEYLHTAPLALETRLIRVLRPFHNDDITRNLMMPGHASLVQVGQSSSGQPILSVMSNTCLAHYEFQALALDDDLRVLNALCIVVRSSAEEIELLEVAEISNAYVLVSLVTFHRTKARKGTSLLLDRSSGLEDPRLFDRVKGALTLEAYPTDPTPVPASQHQLDPRICADWDFWSAELPRWGIVQSMTRIEILSQFGQGDYEKTAIWFLADYLYPQPAQIGTPFGYYEQAPHYTLFQVPLEQAPQHQIYPHSHRNGRPPFGPEWRTRAGAQPTENDAGVAASYASSSEAPARAPKKSKIIRRAGADPGAPAAGSKWGQDVLDSAGPITAFAGPGQQSLPQNQQSAVETPSAPVLSIPVGRRRKLRFKCSECPAAFSRNSNLARHVQVCHECIRKHICDICGWAFAQRSDLKKHVEKKHPNNYDELFGADGTPADEQSQLDAADTTAGDANAESVPSDKLEGSSEHRRKDPDSVLWLQAPFAPTSASKARDVTEVLPAPP
ncbi:hypothetical protein FVE85_8303 [Porphyridium purpureum]|uniref:C2H2-type domain-containing protein n=1 Tax=Porphyridium purpureum TaxID=35688 RepID=A0A5J4YK50_PORPP|nr:hypothetical protein FVE85_8303 [Porphyridium purpureum]|eukprot:POR6282..scf244_11